MCTRPLLLYWVNGKPALALVSPFAFDPLCVCA